MARVQINFELDNASFEDDFDAEVDVVMEAIGEKIKGLSPGEEEDIYDSNGNVIGDVAIIEDGDEFAPEGEDEED